jgi:hypothetical protein
MARLLNLRAASMYIWGNPCTFAQNLHLLHTLLRVPWLQIVGKDAILGGMIKGFCA